MSPEIIAALMFIGVLIGVLSGYPIAFVIGGLGMLFGLAFMGDKAFGLFTLRILMVMKSYILLAVPLFVFMGVMLERSGIAERLYSAMYLWFGGFRGGLAITTVVICTIFAACVGIIGASVVAMGLLALPAMLARGYDKSLATGSICAGGTLGILIPPSIMIVVYGPQAGLSVGKLFMAAFIPGLILSTLYILYIAIRCYLQPHLAPALPPEERRVPLGRKLYLGITSLFPPLFLILAVLGTIFFGLAAPTEAAAMGAVASMLVAAGYRQLNWQNLKEAAFRTLRTTSMVLFVVIGAGFFTSVFMALGGGRW